MTVYGYIQIGLISRKNPVKLEISNSWIEYPYVFSIPFLKIKTFQYWPHYWNIFTHLGLWKSRRKFMSRPKRKLCLLLMLRWWSVQCSDPVRKRDMPRWVNLWLFNDDLCSRRRQVDKSGFLLHRYILKILKFEKIGIAKTMM